MRSLRLLLAISLAGVLLRAAPIPASASEDAEPSYKGKTLSQWIARAEDKSPVLRREAAASLGRLGPASVTALTKMLKDKDGMVQQAAADALGAIGPKAKAAAPALVELLGSKNGWVRASAARALSKLGSPAIPALLESLKSRDAEGQKLAAGVLGRIGSAATPALLELLKSADASVRSAAANALGCMGGKAKPAVAALARLLVDKVASVRLQAARSLRRIDARSPEAKAAVAVLAELLTDETESIRLDAALALANMRSERTRAAAALAELLKSKDALVRLRAARSLCRIAPQSREAEAAVPVLVELLKDNRMPVWYGAGDAIGDLGPGAKAAVPVLEELLGDSQRRMTAIVALGKIGPEAGAAIPALTKLLKDDDRWVRLTATTALGKIDAGSRAAIPGLVEALGDAMHRRVALEALAKLGPAAKPAIPALTKMLTDREKEFRLLAAVVIAKIDPESEVALPVVVEMANDPQPQFRAIEAMGKMGPVAVPALVELVKGRDEYRRGFAVEALGQIGAGAKTAVPALVELLKSENKRLRWTVDEALTRIGPAAIPALRESLTGDDRKFRRAVAEALWRVGPKDETAIPILLELLKDEEGEYRQPADERERMTAFLADRKGRRGSGFPAWIDYRRVVGDTPVTRRLFGRMLAAEPDLCAAVGGDPKRLADLLALRAAALDDSDSIRRGHYRAGLGDVAALFLVAARSDVAPFFDDDLKIHHAIDRVLRYGGVDPPVLRYSTSSHQYVGTDWHHSDPEHRAIQELARRWALREAAPKWLAVRMDVASRFALTDALQPLAMRLLHDAAQPNYAGKWAEFAIRTVRRAHKSEERRLLAAYLERARPLGWELMPRPLRPSPDPEMLHLVDPQLRDLALGVIVELSGKRPADYGFVEYSTTHDPRVYLFQTMEQRNRGFKMCVENYRDLGLERPPAYTREIPPRFFYITWTESRRGLPPAKTSADGEIRLDVQGGTARLIDVASGRQIGKTLDARVGADPMIPLAFNCYSFSPDGKYVATGSGFIKKYPPDEDTRDTNMGRIEVWDAATGELVERKPRGATGSVHTVRFSKDGKVIYYQADKFSRDIS